MREREATTMETLPESKERIRGLGTSPGPGPGPGQVGRHFVCRLVAPVLCTRRATRVRGQADRRTGGQWGQRTGAPRGLPGLSSFLQLIREQEIY